MTRIIGIDPGSRRTGFGILEVRGGNTHYLSSGVVRLPQGELPRRLKAIVENLADLIVQHRVEMMAIEDVFFARDPRAALKLGQARGAAIVAAVQADLPVAEYSARTVKQAVVGSGAASKEQVQHMVKRLLALSATPQEDAADALAIAICHSHSLRDAVTLGGARGFRKGRYR